MSDIDETYAMYEIAIEKLNQLSKEENEVYASSMSKLIQEGRKNNFDEFWYKSVVAEQILMPEENKKKVNLDDYKYVMHVLFAFMSSDAFGDQREKNIISSVSDYIKRFDPENFNKI